MRFHTWDCWVIEDLMNYFLNQTLDDLVSPFRPSGLSHHFWVCPGFRAALVTLGFDLLPCRAGLPSNLKQSALSCFWHLDHYRSFGFLCGVERSGPIRVAVSAGRSDIRDLGVSSYNARPGFASCLPVGVI